jgi:uncharacterized protein (TIGR02117 family)
VSTPIRLLLWLSMLFWATSSWSDTAAPAAPGGADGSVVIYVARRGWHIDIGMAAQDLRAPLDTVAADLPGTRYLFFGFGDKHYLVDNNHNAPAMLGALWPGSAVMLVTGLENTPDAAFGAESVVALTLSGKQNRMLQSFISHSFVTENETIRIYQNGPYEDSLYFLAGPKYSGFHTCNTWAAEALRSAGLPIHHGGVVFAGQLWTQVQRAAAEERGAPGASMLPTSTQ